MGNNISGDAAYQIQLTQKGGIMNGTYTNVSYNGKSYEKCSSPSLFDAMNNYLSEDSPDLTPEEVYKLKGDLDYLYSPYYGQSKSTTAVGESSLFAAKDLLDYYSDEEYSDGGKTITQGEISEIVEKWSNWNKAN